jgi:hypothetical protein
MMFLPVHQHEARLLIRALRTHAALVLLAPELHPVDEHARTAFLVCLIDRCDAQEDRQEAALDVRAGLEIELGQAGQQA